MARIIHKEKGKKKPTIQYSKKRKQMIKKKPYIMTLNGIGPV